MKTARNAIVVSGSRIFPHLVRRLLSGFSRSVCGVSRRCSVIICPPPHRSSGTGSPSPAGPESCALPPTPSAFFAFEQPLRVIAVQRPHHVLPLPPQEVVIRERQLLTTHQGINPG